MIHKTLQMTENLVHGYSSESAQRELFNEYQHDRVKKVFKNICILMLWTEVASALECDCGNCHEVELGILKC